MGTPFCIRKLSDCRSANAELSVPAYSRADRSACRTPQVHKVAIAANVSAVASGESRQRHRVRCCLLERGTWLHCFESVAECNSDMYVDDLWVQSEEA